MSEVMTDVVFGMDQGTDEKITGEGSPQNLERLGTFGRMFVSNFVIGQEGSSLVATLRIITDR